MAKFHLIVKSCGREGDRESEREGQREGVSKWPPRVGITLSFINHFLRFTRRRRRLPAARPFPHQLPVSLSISFCVSLSFSNCAVYRTNKGAEGASQAWQIVDNASWRDKPFITIITLESMCVGVLCVCVCAKGCACVLCLGIGWNSTRFLPCRAWQIKNIADRSKNFHTHLFLFTARNLHIKAEQKDDTARYPFNTHTLPPLSDTSVALRMCV